MIDHINLPVSHIGRSRAIYDRALAVLGYRCIVEDTDVVGYGDDRWGFGLEQVAGHIAPLHVAFAAPSRRLVEAFFIAGTDAGGTPNGAPGLRPFYGASYYAAYLLDPDGHNVEAVFRG